MNHVRCSGVFKNHGLAVFVMLICGVTQACMEGGGTTASSGSSPQPTLQGLQTTAGASAAQAGNAQANSNLSARRPKGAPPEVRAASKEWPTTNRDYAGTRATFDSKINSSNVATLTPAWSLPLGSIPGYVGAATSAPLVLNSVVYYTDELSNVYALDKLTGAIRWQKNYNAPGGAPNGLAVGWGKVFAASSDRSFVALDAATGAELWTAQLTFPQNGGIGIAPIAYDGLVYLSSTPVTANSQYAGGVIGTLYALDQATGRVVWSFQTIKDSSLWGNPQINSGGGAWYPPTIDTDSSAIYWGIGNPAPYPGTDAFPLGSSRPGPNLYTNSVLSLNDSTGRLNWYFQEAPHDLFDLDFQNPPVIVSNNVRRKDCQQLVIGSGKTGTVVALDPKRGGKVVWRASVGKHQNDTITTFGDAGVDVYPGSLGGIDTPIAYAAGFVYVPTVDWGRHYYPTGADPGLIGNGSGELIALDVNDGSVHWKTDLTSTPFASVTVVNDLILTSTLDATLLAFNRNTGAEVWRTQLPNGSNGPITVVDNFVLVPAGIGPGASQLLALKLP